MLSMSCVLCDHDRVVSVRTVSVFPAICEFFNMS